MQKGKLSPLLEGNGDFHNGFEGLGMSIILQAVIDCRRMISGKKVRDGCETIENTLEFFKSDYARILMRDRPRALNIIYKKLKREWEDSKRT